MPIIIKEREGIDWGDKNRIHHPIQWISRRREGATIPRGGEKKRRKGIWGRS